MSGFSITPFGIDNANTAKSSASKNGTVAAATTANIQDGASSTLTVSLTVSGHRPVYLQITSNTSDDANLYIKGGSSAGQMDATISWYDNATLGRISRHRIQAVPVASGDQWGFPPSAYSICFVPGVNATLQFYVSITNGSTANVATVEYDHVYLEAFEL